VSEGPVIELDRVSFGHRGATGVPGPLVIDGLALRVAAGEVVSLLGPSGCGKTTVLNLIAGFLTPSEGDVCVHGERVVGVPARCAMVFQGDALYPWLTVRENVAFGLTCGGRRAAAEADGWLEQVGLAAFAHRLPSELSGGMRQRAALARALAVKADVLLMDEPFGALDAQTRERMQELLADLHSRLRPAVVLVTHDVDEAVFLADRILVLSPAFARIVEEHGVSTPRPRTVAAREAPEAVHLRGQLRRTLRALDPTAATVRRHHGRHALTIG
jgi:NitT/TauT family transport system ATP-binding protein